MSEKKLVVLDKFTPRPYTEEIRNFYQFAWEGKKGNFFVYDFPSGNWSPNAEEIIRKHFRTALDAIEDTLKKQYFINEIVFDVKESSFLESALPEPDINLIPFYNGVYDLRNGEFRPFRPSDYFTSKLPWNYNSNAKSEFLAPLIESTLPEDRSMILFELMAYCLYRGYPNQRFFFLTGSGRNGKSTFATILTNLLGHQNVSNITLSDIQDNRFAGSRLYRKLANISGEVDSHDLKNTRLLKQITGGDQIEADRKFLNPVAFTNYAKPIFLTNQVPITKDTTDAFYRRAYIIEFPKKFDPDATIDIRIRDKCEEMKQEYEALLYIALEHLISFKERKFQFTHEQSVEEVRSLYSYVSNPIGRFMEDSCLTTHDSEDYVYKWEFKERLNEWLKERGFNTYSESKIGRVMKGDLGHEDGRRPSPDHLKQYQAWVGIKWKDTIQTNRDCREIRVDSYFSLPSIETVKKYPEKSANPEITPSVDKCGQCMRSSGCMLTPFMRTDCEGPFDGWYHES